MFTRTKVICTIGPSTCSSEMINKLYQAGMNVARLNMSHETHAGAKKIINIPDGVNVSLSGNDVSVNSAKGTLNFVLTKEVSLKIDANEISVMSSDNQESIAMAGTTRSIINNMIIGLSKGFEKKLELVLDTEQKHQEKLLILHWVFHIPLNMNYLNQ